LTGFSTSRTKGRASGRKKAKKARLYTRYDPTTGQKVRVYADSFEYASWPSRKPSKKKLAREAFKTDPFGTTGTIAQTAAKRSIERLGEHTATRVLRTARTGAVPAALAGARALAPLAIPLAVAAGTVAAGIAGFVAISRAERRLAADRINEISRAFVATQKQVEQQLGVSSWQQVPSDLRAKLVKGYTDAIHEVSAGIYHAGSLQPSKQIPYGR
jgi:hypothetical protein